MSLINNIFIKPEKDSSVIELDFIKCLRNFGLENSYYNSSISPRQVLIVQKEVLDKYGLNPGDLRENITTIGVDIDNLRSGTVLQLGNTVKLRLTFNCEICNNLTSKIKLKTTKSLSGLENYRGMLAVVLNNGEFKKGDEIRVLEDKFSFIPTNFKERFFEIIKEIPEGKIIDYKTLGKVLGVAIVYLRTFPVLIKRADPNRFPTHRIVDSSGMLIKYVDNQENKLKGEGVEVKEGIINIEKYLWNSEMLYFK